MFIFKYQLEIAEQKSLHFLFPESSLPSRLRGPKFHPTFRSQINRETVSNPKPTITNVKAVVRNKPGGRYNKAPNLLFLNDRARVHGVATTVPVMDQTVARPARGKKT